MTNYFSYFLVQFLLLLPHSMALALGTVESEQSSVNLGPHSKNFSKLIGYCNNPKFSNYAQCRSSIDSSCTKVHWGFKGITAVSVIVILKLFITIFQMLFVEQDSRQKLLEMIEQVNQKGSEKKENNSLQQLWKKLGTLAFMLVVSGYTLWNFWHVEMARSAGLFVLLLAGVYLISCLGFLHSIWAEKLKDRILEKIPRMCKNMFLDKCKETLELSFFERFTVYVLQFDEDFQKALDKTTPSREKGCSSVTIGQSQVWYYWIYSTSVVIFCLGFFGFGKYSATGVTLGTAQGIQWLGMISGATLFGFCFFVQTVFSTKSFSADLAKKISMFAAAWAATSFGITMLPKVLPKVSEFGTVLLLGASALVVVLSQSALNPYSADTVRTCQFEGTQAEFEIFSALDGKDITKEQRKFIEDAVSELPSDADKFWSHDSLMKFKDLVLVHLSSTPTVGAIRRPLADLISEIKDGKPASETIVINFNMNYTPTLGHAIFGGLVGKLFLTAFFFITVSVLMYSLCAMHVTASKVSYAVKHVINKLIWRFKFSDDTRCFYESLIWAPFVQETWNATKILSLYLGSGFDADVCEEAEAYDEKKRQAELDPAYFQGFVKWIKTLPAAAMDKKVSKP